MISEQEKVLRTFRMRNILLPVIIGFGIAAIFIYRDLMHHGFKHIRLDSNYLYWFFMALLMICIRHLAYMYRIWLLSDKKIHFKHSFSTIMLWEFSSCLTPTVVGGTAVAFFIINREGIKMGRTTAIVLITAFLDEAFFILLIPIFILLGIPNLFIEGSIDFSSFSLGFREVFLIGYIIIFILTFLMFYGVFINPHAVKWLFLKIANLPFFKRWKEKAETTGNDIITASKEFKHKSLGFWIKSFLSTSLSWSARYLTVNFLILMFVTSNDQFLIFVRQMLMWVILLVSPTPGASGIAEYGFTVFLGEFLPDGISSSLAFLWRLISYYPYILAGMFVLPVWLRRTSKNKSTAIERQKLPENSSSEHS